MPDDYASQSDGSSSSADAFKWAFIGFSLCVLCVMAWMFYGYMQRHPKESLSPMMIASTEKPATNMRPTSSKAAHKKDRYEFYQTLTHQHGQTTARHTPTITHTKNVVHQASRYSLQVASVQHFNEADRLKAQLLLQGYKVKIKKAKVGHRAWHRVIIGPYAKEEALRVQSHLKKNHYQIMMIKKST